jgi:hypothetical protein
MKHPKGDRAFVELLMVAGETELDALTVACELALESGSVTGPVVLNELRRLMEPPVFSRISIADDITLMIEPFAGSRACPALIRSAV